MKNLPRWLVVLFVLSLLVWAGLGGYYLYLRHPQVKEFLPGRSGDSVQEKNLLSVIKVESLVPGVEGQPSAISTSGLAPKVVLY